MAVASGCEQAEANKAQCKPCGSCRLEWPQCIRKAH